MATTSAPEQAPAASYTAFHGSNRIASGALEHVAAEAKTIVDSGQTSLIIIFNDATSHVVDLDFRGTTDDVRRRAAALTQGVSPVDGGPDERADAPRGPGRPRLGVVAREVTLLPRHWAWLNSQPGGASVALRRLVEEARRTHAGRDRVRDAQEAAYRFMSAMGGNLTGFEEAARALFAGHRGRFEALIATWPEDVRDHALALATPAFAATA